MPSSPFSSKPYANLRKVGATATALEAHGQADGWENVWSNRKLHTLRAYYLNQDQASRLGTLRGLRRLRIFNGLVNDLSSLGELPALRHLELQSIGHLRDFSFLGRIRKLETLKVIDVSRFKDVSILAKLPQLRAVEIGTLIPWTTLPTLASFAGLKQVRVLDLNYHAKDGSLSPLAELSNLQELSLPLTYELKEYARLATALPHVKCVCFTRPYNHWASSFVNCRRCGGHERLTLARGQRALCPACDGDKLQAYLKTFEELKAGFQNGVRKKRSKASKPKYKS